MIKEQITKRLEETKGKEIHVWLYADAIHYFGRHLGSDEDWLDIIDFKTGKRRLIFIDNIKNVSLSKDQRGSK